MMTEKEEDQQESTDTQRRCGRFGAEFTTTSFFDVMDSNGQTFDLEASFCLGENATWFKILVKLVLWGWAVSTYTLGFIQSTYTGFYMAYISYWSVLYVCVYMTLSLGTTVVMHPWPLFVKATWCMFSVAIVHSLMVVLLFWTTEYNPEKTVLTYPLIMSHAGTFLITFLDGSFLNCVPIRLKHAIVAMAFGALFMGWTAIQNFFVDNPYTDDEDETEALYNILDWGNSPGQAAIVCVIVIFVAFPLFEILFWSLSLCGRRYISIEAEGEKANEEADIEHSPNASVNDGEDTEHSPIAYVNDGEE